MISIPGYDIITQTHSENHISRFLGRSADTGSPVAVSFFPIEPHHARGGNAILAAYRKLLHVASEHVVRVHAVESAADGARSGLILITDPPAGMPLRGYVHQHQLSIQDFLDIAVGLATAVNDMHKAGFIHKGISFGKIHIDPDSRHIRVTDFADPSLIGQQSLLGKDRNWDAKDSAAGALAYISPELTGRMNRPVDFRTDFYSLGAIFYELLTGSPPITGSSAKQIIHGHIAHSPAPPAQARNEIPRPISEIVMKLLQKIPENRYQSAYGLRADLNDCREQISGYGHIRQNFHPARQDASQVLVLSNRVFGREADMERLRREFDFIRRGNIAVVMITGTAGMGKSRLAEAFGKYAMDGGAYFCKGGFEDGQQNIPYTAILQAFRDLIAQILSESAAEIKEWRQTLNAALGKNAGIITAAIPELEYIIDKQPPVPELPPAEAQNRFNMTFENFFQSLASKIHPLVIFIDNMQWADSASLSQLEAFFTDTSAQYILLIGACREEETPPAHPLKQALAGIERKGVRVRYVSLKPLPIADIKALVQDSLKRTLPDLDGLADWIEKTAGGNPISVRQLLTSLQTEGLLLYDYETGCWQWDLKRLKARPASPATVDFMTDQMGELLPATLKVLETAACIGSRFDLLLLSLVDGRAPLDVAVDLWEAVEKQLLIAEGDSYQRLRHLLVQHLPPLDAEKRRTLPGADQVILMFHHETLRQALYERVPEMSKKERHLQIGYLLLNLADEAQPAKTLFQAVHHLNLGVDKLTAPAERVRLAGLNLKAGQQALESRAYQQARTYLETGRRLLPETAWDDHYRMMFGLLKGQMECAYLMLDFEAAEDRFRVLIQRAATDMDRATIYNLKMMMLASLAKHEEALEIGLDGLKGLGVNLSGSAGRLSVLKSMLSTRFRLWNRDTQSLLKLPVIDDERLALSMEILINLCFSAFLCSPFFAIVASLKVIDFTLKYGNSKASAFGYMVYGASMCAIFKNYRAGRKFGELALKANDIFGTPALVPNLLLLYGGGISVWTAHVDEALEAHRRGVKTALETGNANYAVYHIQSVLIFLIVSGAPLEAVIEEHDRYVRFVENSKDIGALNYLRSAKQFVLALKGRTTDAACMDNADFEERRHVENIKKGGIQLILLRHYLLKLRLCYIMGDIDGALEAGKSCRKLLHYHLGTIIIPEFQFFYALALAAAYDTAPKHLRPGLKGRIRRYRRQLASLAKQCPENFRHKYLIVAAEHERISGRPLKAMACYHRGADNARENKFIQHYAIANELAAKFYLNRQFGEIAHTCLRAAVDGYQKWGAEAKAERLRKQHPSVFPVKIPHGALSAYDPLDFSAIVDALQTISTEIVLPDLLNRLMQIVLGNAGATRAQFLTLKADRMYLEAEHSVTAEQATIFKTIPADGRVDLFMPVLNYVRRTGKLMVIDDAVNRGELTANPYVQKHAPRSVLCLPVFRQTRMVALLYLENSAAPAVFTPTRIEVLKLLASQAAISLENAKLYENVIQNEKELREITQHREEESLRYQAQLRSLSSQLSLTEERERRRIASELHDRIGHALTHASMKLKQLGSKKGEDADSIGGIDDIHALIEQSIQDTQTLTFELSPPILYDLGLEAAIDWLAEQTEAQHGIAIRCIDDMTDKPIEESLRVLLFQAVRELLFNVVKHARATQVTISVSRRDDQVRVVIEDNGVGFDIHHPRPASDKKGGFGLFSIRERMAHQGGSLKIRSEPGKGARFTLISPMKGIDSVE